ncbi:helix-turn-helix domain-containing protein [[Clostridium] symbiosum]|uniref:helix-turn-helix domain-containing protein n=1 Tax=Clostridium symbiosum TaxID=1512 RepID=UPI00321B1A46
MQNNFSHVGVRIISKLKQLGIKQADLCRETGISSNAISQYCTGKRVPDTTSLYKMAGVLKTSMEWILTGKDTMGENTITESLFCDGEPLSEAESDLVAMYRLVSAEDRKTIFDITTLKYEQSTGERGSVYSTYTDTNESQKNGSNGEPKSHHEAV